MSTVDLKEELVSLSVFEHQAEGRIGFSDLPELLIPGLVEAFGKEAVADVLTPSQIEVDFMEGLDMSTRSRTRLQESIASGALDERVDALDRQGLIPKQVPYFMTAINRSDEAILGRTGGLYFVCPKGCHFCQYRDFDSRLVTPQGIADRMLALQEAGADNIQWISPTAHTRALLKGALLAGRMGLSIPIVHNSEGEDSIESLRLLDGVVDVYLPDAKFLSPAWSERIGLGKGYGERLKAALAEMLAQVGALRRGPGAVPLAAEGVLVRHLIMPEGVREAGSILSMLRDLDPGLPVHLMSTYQPLHDAAHVPGIGRHVERKEVEAVAREAKRLKLTRVYVR